MIDQKLFNSLKPIKHGGAKVAIIVLLAVLVFFALSMRIALWMPSFEVWIVLNALALLIAFVVAKASARVICGDEHTDWWDTYFKRNVQGYPVVWYYLDGEGLACRFGDSRVGEVENQRSSFSGDTFTYVIEMPIGGWRKSGKLICKGKVVERVQIKRVYDHFVSMQDNRGSCIHDIGVKELLVCLHIGGTSLLANAFERCGQRYFELKDVCDENRNEALDHKLKYDAILIIIEGWIEEVKDTSRFGKSTEAKKFREQMESVFFNYLPDDSPKKDVYRKRICNRGMQEDAQQAAVEA